jgi:ubiquinone/menaquinone biosynthesis C-methylase UbiE
MPDVYSIITEVGSDVIDLVGDAMELRAADPQQQAMLAAYLGEVRFPDSARVLEVGCGTGAIARALAARSGIGEVVGVDPSPGLLARARDMSSGFGNLSFREADGRHLPLPDADVDVVVAHTVLSHVPAPEGIITEAYRVLRPGGTLAAFDGDYSTISVALEANDPLQTCVQAVTPAFINDPWVMRRMAGVLRAAGFTDLRVRSHGYVQINEPLYMISLVDRGADVLASGGIIGTDLAAALKAEARRRVEAGRFYGQISYTSLVAGKPVTPSG